MSSGRSTVSRASYNAASQLLLYERYDNVAPTIATSPSALPGMRQPDERRSYAYAAAQDANFMRGDLQTITVEYPTATPAVAPQITRFTRYDRAGRVLAFTGADGSQTTLTYHARGWLTQHSYLPAAGNLQVTSYVYDAAGQLKKATLPDQSWVSFTYDAAQRLTGIADSAGNAETYTLDAASNRTATQRSGSQNQLVRNLARALYPHVTLPTGTTALASTPAAVLLAAFDGIGMRASDAPGGLSGGSMPIRLPWVPHQAPRHAEELFADPEPLAEEAQTAEDDHFNWLVQGAVPAPGTLPPAPGWAPPAPNGFDTVHPDYPGVYSTLPEFGQADRRARATLERAVSDCMCRPNGGYAKPTLTLLSYAHLLASGHLAPMFRSKSYFTVDVNQAFLDEVMSKAVLQPSRNAGREEWYAPDMGRTVGSSPLQPPHQADLAPRRDVTIIIEANNCSRYGLPNFRGRNEVVTMYPGRSDGR